MSDIGPIFSPGDIVLIVLVVCSPGIAIGGIIGAYKWPQRRILGALAGAAAGFLLCFAGWWIYLTAIK